MRLAIDTNRYSDHFRGVPEAVDAVQQATEIFLPFIVVAELRSGFLKGSRRQENERALKRFISSPRTSVLYPDDQTANHYATLDVQLRRQGTPIPTNDLWIAALAVQHGLTLFARDTHFDLLPQVTRL